MSDFTYKIIEDNENPLLKKIEKTGTYSTEFTMAQINADEVANTRLHKELTAKLAERKAVKENVLEHNDFIKNMSEKDIHACWYYWEAHAFIKPAEDKIAEIEETLKELSDEKANVNALINEEKDN